MTAERERERGGDEKTSSKHFHFHDWRPKEDGHLFQKFFNDACEYNIDEEFYRIELAICHVDERATRN